MATQNLHLGASLLDDLSSLHFGGKISLINQSLIFQEHIIQSLIIHFVKFLGLLLYTLFPPAEIQSFCSLLGLPSAGVEEQRGKTRALLGFALSLELCRRLNGGEF